MMYFRAVADSIKALCFLWVVRFKFHLVSLYSIAVSDRLVYLKIGRASNPIKLSPVFLV